MFSPFSNFILHSTQHNFNLICTLITCLFSFIDDRIVKVRKWSFSRHCKVSRARLRAICARLSSSVDACILLMCWCRFPSQLVTKMYTSFFYFTYSSYIEKSLRTIQIITKWKLNLHPYIQQSYSQIFIFKMILRMVNENHSK